MKVWKMMVEMTTDDAANKMHVHEYVTDAVGSYCGSLRPPGANDPGDDGDPMWGVKGVKVTCIGNITLRPKRTLKDLKDPNPDGKDPIRQVARDYVWGPYFEVVTRDAMEQRKAYLIGKLAEMGLRKVTEATKEQEAELFGWFKDRIMANLTPIAREFQAWINAEDTTEYNRRRKLALKKLDEMKLKRVSDATDAQQVEIREWIASKP
jgi:hypothetical protein